MSLVELIGLANNIRLSCQPMRLELAKLFRVARPIILVLKNQHYVVLKSGVHNKLTLHDPLRGYLIMSREQVEHLYSGVALLVLPGAQRVGEPKNDFLAEVQAPLNHFPLRRLFRLHSENRGPFYKALMSLVLSEMLILAGPYLLQRLIDQVLIAGEFESLPTIVGVMMLLGGLYVGLIFISTRILAQFATRKVDLLRSGLGLGTLAVLMLFDLRIALLTLAGGALLALLCQAASPANKEIKALKALVLVMQATLILWMASVAVQVGSLSIGMFIAVTLFAAHFMHSAYGFTEHLAKALRPDSISEQPALLS
jgi:ABC-type bacteriocin/lantibiotic exporter with double-glycine peptidase domain